jgi:hypothetical protein
MQRSLGKSVPELRANQDHDARERRMMARKNVRGRKLSVHDMLREWLRAEATNPQRWMNLGGFADERLQRRLETGGELTNTEWLGLEDALRNFRAPLLDELLPLPVNWCETQLPLDTLGSIRVLRHFFASVAPCQILREVVDSLERNSPDADPSLLSNFRAIRKSFTMEAMCGRPILVATSTRGRLLS